MAATAASNGGADPASSPASSGPIAIVAAEEDQRLISNILSGRVSNSKPVSFTDLSKGILDDSFAAAILTEDVLRGVDWAEFATTVGRELSWSDFPFLLVYERAALPALSGFLNAVENVTLIERPIHPLVLAKAAKAALRARARQGGAVDLLLQRSGAEEHLRELTTTLENRVRERMRDLRAANYRLVQEVRERQAAEERLRESEELYRYTVELSQQIVWTASPDGRLVSVNPRFYEVTGVSEDVAPYDAWLQVVHPDDAPQLPGYWVDALASGQPHQSQFRIRIADGSYRVFVGRAAPRRDEEGRIIRWYGFTEDVTEQKRADAARREAEERYRLAARATNDAIWDLDLSTEHIHWTASETAFFGYRNAQEMTNLSWWEERVHPEDHQRVTGSLKAAIAGDGTHWQENYRLLVAGEEYAEVFDQGFIIRDEAGEAVRMVGAMSDRTEHRRAEAEVRRIQAELIHVSRLSAMGTMASTLAHEVNQPLTAVSSYIRGSRRLLENVEAAAMEDVRGALAAAESAALRAGHIVKRLRELVSRGNVSPRPARLAKIIQDAGLIAFLDEHLLGAMHRIELDSKAEWVEVDPIQIQQVLINLVRNALQALDGQPRREIVIRTSLVSKSTAQVSVSDTGPGIPSEVREALFTPFLGTKVEGMGIGLSISRTIIEAHGGRIWAEDAPGGGTIFRFTLPRIQAPDDDANEAAV